MAKQADEALPVLVENVSPVSRTGSPILTLNVVDPHFSSGCSPYDPLHSWDIKTPLDLIVLDRNNALFIFKNYDTQEKIDFDIAYSSLDRNTVRVSSAQYYEIEVLQKQLSPSPIFRSLIASHYAYVNHKATSSSLVEVTDFTKGIIRIHDLTHDFLVRFSPSLITKMMPKIWYGPQITIDEYTGLVAIRSTDPHCRRGEEELGSGYIFESPPRIINLFLKKLAIVENIQEGKVKIFTSSFDAKGYEGRLFPPFILEMTQTLDRVIDSFYNQKSVPEMNSFLKLDQDAIKQKFIQLTSEVREIREVREIKELQKEETPPLAKEEVHLGSLSLASNVEESAVLLSGHNSVDDFFDPST
jgi:hypothetical protein